MNKNDLILHPNDFVNQINFDDFEYKDKFNYLCDLIPIRRLEKLVIKNADDNLIKRAGLVYLFILNNKLLKVGSATTSFLERVSSYNCGKKAYRKNGTCSTTNYFVLQNLLNINKPIKVYYYFPDQISMNVWGTTKNISLPAKEFEKKILTELKENNNLPILCTQK